MSIVTHYIIFSHLTIIFRQVTSVKTPDLQNHPKYQDDHNVQNLSCLISMFSFHYPVFVFGDQSFFALNSFFILIFFSFDDSLK